MENMTKYTSIHVFKYTCEGGGKGKMNNEKLCLRVRAKL